MTSPWTPSKETWGETLVDHPKYRVDQLWKGLYEQGVPIAEMTALPAGLRAQLSEAFPPALERDTEQRSSDGATVKWLWRLPDGAAIETVLMHYDKRSTVCVSSQAGCAMGCGFCATGQGGYERNLEAGEIIEQLIAARAAAAPRRLSNVVFMGMGEPFANYDRLMIAIRRIIGELGIGARHVTVSTIGLVPQMLRFAEEGLQVGLAVSLHAANDSLRTELIPVNKRHPLSDLVAASQLFRERTGRRVSYEWALIDGVNDRDSDAAELIEVAHASRAHVNLIPLNPTPGWPVLGSPPARVEAFCSLLTAGGVNATVRKNRGTDIDAACGQLKARERSTAVSVPVPKRPETG